MSYKDKIYEALTAATKAAGYDAMPLVVRNADQSVDGESRIILARGADERDVIRALQTIVIPDNVWFTVGTRYEDSVIPDERRDHYLRWRGYREAVQGFDTSYVRGEIFERALSIADKMRKRYRRKASEVVIRLRYDVYAPATRPVKKAGLGPNRKGKLVPKKRKSKKRKSKARKVRRKTKRKVRKKGRK